MSRLALYLLGPPQLELDGQAIHIGRRKVLALLAYLALTRKRHSRETLAAVLAPEFDQAGARADLRRTLSLLNAVLGAGWLVADRETVGLNPEADLWLDVDGFRQRLAACEEHGHPLAQVCPDCVPLLEEAIALYQDDFMAGFTLPGSLPFDEWQRYQTEALRNDLGSALDRLSDCHAVQGESKPAISAAQRWLELDPLHEAAHRRLMELYARAGRSSAALRQYRGCVRLLEQELGVPPSAETTALYERLRDERLVREERPAPAPARKDRATALPAFLEEDTAPIRVERSVFVARETELARLDGYLETALAGQSRVAFITGGPGRGKTALMREFAWRAMETHPELLAANGSCNAFAGVGDPYLPFREVLAMLTGDVESRWAAGAITREHARRLWDICPGTLEALADYGPSLIDSLLPAAALLSRAAAVGPQGTGCLEELKALSERERLDAGGLEPGVLLAQYTRVLQTVALQRPLLLTLDDLQWADAGSIGLLFHLGQRLADAGSRILIIGAYRPEEVAQGRDGEPHPLGEVLTEFKRRFGNVWLDLARVQESESRRFVDAFLNTEPNRLGKPFREALFQRTGGHPLFTIELLRAMQERGGLVQDESGRWVEGPSVDWQRQPARVEAVIEIRVGRLEGELRDLLNVASVEGERFTAQVVARASGVPEREALQALSELCARHRLLREAGEVTINGRFLSRYHFGHALFQAFLYGRLSVGERRLLHGEIGGALEELYEHRTDAIAPALAFHYQAAGQLDKAAAYALRAGNLAGRIYAFEEAVDHYHRSLKLYRGTGNRSGEASVLERLGEIHSKWSELPEAKAYWLEALRIYRELGDRKGEALTLSHLGFRNLLSKGDYNRAEHYFAQAVQIWREIDEPHGLVNTLGGLGRFHREHTGDFERSRAYGLETLRLSREIGNQFNEAYGNYVIGFANHYQGDYSAADPFLKEAVRLFGENSRTGEFALCLVGVGLNAIALGDSAAAQVHLERSRLTFREVHKEDLSDDAFAESALALLYHQLGDDQTARDHATRAVAIHRKTGYHYRTATALNRLGHALTALGELTEATAAYHEALDLRCQMGQRHLAPEPLAGLARVALAWGEPAAALTYTEEILSHLETGSVDGTDEPLRIYLICYRVLKANDDARAEKLLEEGYNLLQERAAKITDNELRHSFWENVAAHRELVSEWQAAGRDRLTRP